MCPKLTTHIPEICEIWIGSTIVLLTSSLSFQPNQEAMDNFNAVGPVMGEAHQTHSRY